MQIQVDKDTKKIVAYGQGLSPSDEVDVIEASSEQIERLSEPGEKTYDEELSEIVVTPPASPPDAMTTSTPFQVLIEGLNQIRVEQGREMDSPITWSDIADAASVQDADAQAQTE